MSFVDRWTRRGAIAAGIAAALAIAACTPAGRIGQMSKFDISKASPDDITEALQKDGRVAISGGVLFETDSAKLAPSSEQLVKRLADYMKEHPDLKVAVVGNTDNTGDFKYNIQLSERRAKSFMDALIKNGVAADRLAAVGVGPLNPVDSNASAEGRAENRRVELVVIQ
jgi:outer membrane protein OmpA-like peptidoglycan-associated protein